MANSSIMGRPLNKEDINSAASLLEVSPAHVRALIEDWQGFAKGYNGPAYEKNRYNQKLAGAFERCRSEPEEQDPADHQVKELQKALNRHDFSLTSDKKKQ